MNELLSFSRVLEEKLRQSPFTTHEQIGRQIALFARMVQDYDDSLMGGGRWHTSGELKAADQQRDNAQSCFLKQIRIYANHYDAERRAQGQLLAILAQKYADKTRISHSEQMMSKKGFEVSNGIRAAVLMTAMFRAEKKDGAGRKILAKPCAAFPKAQP